MLRGKVIRDGGATVLEREFRDMLEVEDMRAKGFHVDVLAPDEASPAPDEVTPVAPPAAKKAGKAKAK